MKNNTMRALAALDSNTLKIVEIPIPEPDDYEVLVKNEGCSFCNTTDKMIVKNLITNLTHMHKNLTEVYPFTLLYQKNLVTVEGSCISSSKEQNS